MGRTEKSGVNVKCAYVNLRGSPQWEQSPSQGVNEGAFDVCMSNASNKFHSFSVNLQAQ